MPKLPPKHNKKDPRKEYDKDRKPAHKRGYDSAWQKVRNLKLRLNPLCERCEKEGKIIMAEMVHHIIPIDQGGARLGMENLESLCYNCHNKEHKGNNYD